MPVKEGTSVVTLRLAPHGVEAEPIHPGSQAMDVLAVIFADLGFSLAECPDIETDDYNFTPDAKRTPPISGICCSSVFQRSGTADPKGRGRRDLVDRGLFQFDPAHL